MKVHLIVKWIGTHAEYSKLCDEGKQYEVDVYYTNTERIKDGNFKIYSDKEC
jgi:hypothetical protein